MSNRELDKRLIAKRVENVAEFIKSIREALREIEDIVERDKPHLLELLFDPDYFECPLHKIDEHIHELVDAVEDPTRACAPILEINETLEKFLDEDPEEACQCEAKGYDAWKDPENEKVFDNEKGFCAICHKCGLWHCG